jgi:Na+/glutamate symporter
MIGVVPSSSMVGGWDTAGAVSAFPNTTLQSGYYTAMAAASFELKLVP